MSFVGREDPAIEQAMMGELARDLVRLVEGLRRFEDRDGYRDDHGATPRREVVRPSDRPRPAVPVGSHRDGGVHETGDLYRGFEDLGEGPAIQRP